MHSTETGAGLGLLGGVLVAMWNYMGWDNASTIAQEVEKPQRTYPKAMIAAVVLVSLTYVLPFLAVYVMGVPASAFAEDGSWATVAGLVGGKVMGFEWLRFLVVLGGMMSAFGMFNALVMSYSRLPLAMARDGMLPKIFAKTSARTQAPWVAIIACATCWALCLGLGFKRLVTLDIMLYGAALMLEFVTLVALRIREPQFEARIPRARRIGRRDSCRRISADIAEYRHGRKRIAISAGDEWAGIRCVDHWTGVWFICFHAQVAETLIRRSASGSCRTRLAVNSSILLLRARDTRSTTRLLPASLLSNNNCKELSD